MLNSIPEWFEIEALSQLWAAKIRLNFAVPHGRTNESLYLLNRKVVDVILDILDVSKLFIH